MECNEGTDLTSKIETDSWIESRMTAKKGREGAGIEQKGKRIHLHGQQCGDW